MLHEFFLYISTSCPGHVRSMGYLYEVIALKGRHGRNRLSWEPHLANSRQAVLKAAERCRDRERVVVLGAGLLLDVPLAELAEMFKEVVLVDIVFLPGVHWQAKRFGNVSLMEHDVTGAAERLYRFVRMEKKSSRRYAENCPADLPDARPALPEAITGAGLVVSLNILSQLAVVPRAYVKKHFPGMADNKLDAWCRHSADLHNESLRNLSGQVCLVSDFWYVKRDRDGRFMEEGSTIEGIDLSAPDASWTWAIAPIGDLSQAFSRELKVGAWYVQPERT